MTRISENQKPGAPGLEDLEDDADDGAFKPTDFQVLALWTEDKEKDKAPPVADAKADKADKKDDVVDALLKSENETDRQAGEALKAMAESEDETEKADAVRLVKMLGNEKDRALAISLLTNIVDPKTRHAFFTIADDPKFAAATAKMTEMLINTKGELDAPVAVASLLTRLDSPDKDYQADGKQLLDMLNSPKPDVQADGAFLLRIMGYDNGNMHSMLALMKDPARAAEVEDIMKLLKGPGHSDYRAGMALLNLCTSTDATVVSDRQKLIAMLKDEKTRGASVDIMASLEQPEHIHQMLEILNDPKLKRAAETLLGMLHSEEGTVGDYRTAESLLSLLANQHEPEKTDGQRFLKLLNSEVPAERESAEAVLRATHDSEYRHNLLPLIEDATTRAGVMKLFDITSTARRREREPWQELVAKLGSTDPTEVAVAKAVIGLLAGDEKDQSLAKTLIKELDTDEQRQNLLTLLKSHKEEAEKLLGWLRGEPAQRSAARNLLAMTANPIVGDIFDRPERRRAEGGRQPHQVLFQVLPLLKTKDGEALLLTMANEFDTSSRLSSFYKDYQDPDTAAGCKTLIKMLQSTDATDKQAARTMIEMMDKDRDFMPRGGIADNLFQRGQQERPGDGKLNATSAKLLAMLGDEKQAATAKTILTGLNTVEARGRLLVLMSKPETAPIADRLLKMIADNKPGAAYPIGFAEQLLKEMKEPQQLRKVFELMDAKERSPGEERLLGMLRWKDEAGFEVVRMLASPDEAIRKIGEEQVERLGSKRDSWSAASLLRMGLEPKELQMLQSLQADRATRAAAEQLINLLQGDNQATRAGALRVLSMLTSKDAQTAKDGRFFVEMLGKNDTRGVALDLLREVRDADALKRMVRALQDPAEKESAMKLLNIFKQTPDDEGGRAKPGEEILEKLSSPTTFSADRAVAEKLFKMLGDKAQEPLADAIIKKLPLFEQQKKLLELIEAGNGGTEQQKKIAATVLELTLSNNVEDQLALRRVLSMLAQAPEVREGGLRLGPVGAFTADAETLLKMLSDPATRADAKTILSKLDAGDCSVFMGLMTSDNAQTKAAAKELLTQFRSGNAQAALALFKQATGVSPGNLRKFMLMLGDPATVDSARKALALCDDGNVSLVADMLATEEGKKNLDKLTKLAGANERQTAMAILSVNDAKEAALMLALLEDPAKKEAASILIGLLADTDNNEALSASRNILRLMSSPDEAKRKAGDRLLGMLGNADTRELGQIIAQMNLGGNPTTLLNILEDPKFAVAASVIDDLFRDKDDPEPRLVQTLVTMLDSADPKEREQGRRLLDKLNDPAEKFTALRILRRSQSFGGFRGGN